MPMFLLLFSMTVMFADSSCSSLICAKFPTKIFFVSLNHNNGLEQKTHCATLCSIANKGSSDVGQETLKYFIANLKLHLHSRNAIRTALMASSSILLLPSLMPHAHSIHYCCLELDDVIRGNKHAIAMMLYTRSTISRGLKAKNFTIMG